MRFFAVQGKNRITLNLELMKGKVKMMQSKQYLKQAYRVNELIQCNQKELVELRLLADTIPGIDYSKDKVQTSASNDAGYTRTIEKIIELEDVIKKDIEKLVSLKLEIRNVIDTVQDNEERLLLKLRYLNFLTWENICYEMSVSMRTAHRIHGVALTHVKVPE